TGPASRGRPPADAPARRSQSSRPSGGSLRIILAHPQRARVGVRIRRYPQVDRRWRSLEHAARKIKPRTMAGAEEPARPAPIKLARAKALLWQAPEVRAGAHQHQELRAARAQRVLRVRGLLGTVRTRILKL